MHEIQQMSATALVGAIRRREISAREAVAAHLERIEAVDPAVNAVVTLDPERAYAAADAADRLTASGADLPPLHGLPMTHKDTHAVAGMRSTNGSRVLADHVPAEDDAIIARLRGAGVIATGKTNVPEFGAGSHTFNDVFGTTTNPYDPTRSAGGSSGGVAAAIAAGVQPLGEGSDMGGSLRIPASFCNVVGLRPSYGVIPAPAADNDWAWLARTGPMAREVDDIALFMAAVAGPSERVRPPAPLTGTDFSVPVAGDLRGVRIGWSPDFGLGVPVEPEVLDVLTGRLRVFEEAGAIVEEAAPDLTGADEVFHVTRALDFAAGLGPLVREHRELIKPEVVWNVEAGWALSAERIIAATAARTRLARAVRDFYTRFDLFLSPAAQVVPFDARLRFPSTVDGVEPAGYLDWMRSACVLSATGLPVLAMPAGFTASGLPVGFQLAADHYRDVELLRYARAFEDRTRCVDRRPEISAGTGQDVRRVTTVPAG
ncbi:amidase [Nocardiopsis sp. Huas11]|uniref:amidase n=1 Tax=Nocardiopsis sp. Huas11 TaxID=2183912 RepID=UPI000EB212A5|nr:amidase family protein [Nocardiopsis sp. Huas11]RKS06454.1 amidase [Nocardiopsis sp. Huas11]